MSRAKRHTSELRKSVSAEKFELIFKDFMVQADKNSVTGKSNGKKNPVYPDDNNFDGAKFLCQYGYGAASKTPHINWWVLSVYYIPDSGEIIMGIEDYRYPYLDKMNPILYKKTEHKKTALAVFYETDKNSVDYQKLYDRFMKVSEEIIKLGVVDYNTI